MRQKILVCVTILFSISAFAFESTNIPDRFPSIGRTTRPLGMGNAYLTMPGKNAGNFYYNPASINDYEKNFSFEIFSPQIDFSTATIGLIKDLRDLQDNLDGATDSGKVTVFDNFFNNHIGEFHSLSLWSPLFSMWNKNMFIGTVTDAKVDISFRNKAFPNFEIRTEDVAGLAGGTAFSFLEESLQVGIGVKFLYKLAFSEIITTADALAPNFGDKFGFAQWKKGFGFGADLGATYHIPDFGSKTLEFLKPTTSLVYQDIGHTRFSGGAPKTPQSVSAGFGLHPEFELMDLSLLVDFREIMRNMDLIAKLHGGLEARFFKKSWIRPSLRVGANQGYPAFGGGLEIGFVDVQVAYFAEEMGTVSRQKGNYRLAGTLGFNW